MHRKRDLGIVVSSWLGRHIARRDIRYQRAARTSLIIFAGRILQILTTLVTIPLLSRYLGAELLGLWLLVTSFTGFLMFADLGIGMGFQNQLIRCFADGNRREPGVWVANTLLIMLLMGVSIVAVALTLLPLLPLDRWIANVSIEARQWVVPSMIALSVSFAIGLPAMLIEYVGNAYQRGYLAHGVTSLGRAIGLIGVCLGCYFQVSIVTLIITFVATPHLINLLGMAVLWWYVPWLRPDWRAISLGRIGQLLQFGLGMLGVRITHALAMQGPCLLVANLHGLTEAAVISVVQKVLQLPGMIAQPLQTALQGALGEAAHNGEWNWIARNLSRLTKITCSAFVVATLGIVAMGGDGVGTLLGTTSLEPSRFLLLALCLHAALAVVRMGFSVFLTVTNRVYSQAAYRSLALFGTILAVYWYQLGTTQIVLSFVVFAELPQLACTLAEARLVLRRGRSRIAASGLRNTANCDGNNGRRRGTLVDQSDQRSIHAGSSIPIPGSASRRASIQNQYAAPAAASSPE